VTSAQKPDVQYHSAYIQMYNTIQHTSRCKILCSVRQQPWKTLTPQNILSSSMPIVPSIGELSAVAAHSWLDGLKAQGACRYAHRKKGICRNTMPRMGELSAVAAYSWQDGLKAQGACRLHTVGTHSHPYTPGLCLVSFKHCGLAVSRLHTVGTHSHPYTIRVLVGLFQTTWPGCEHAAHCRHTLTPLHYQDYVWSLSNTVAWL